MAKKLEFEKVLSQQELLMELKKDFEEYIIDSLPYNMGIVLKKRKITTQNVTIKIIKKKNRIVVSTPLDRAFLYLIRLPPVGIYIYIHRKRHKALRKVVVDKITAYHHRSKTHFTINKDQKNRF